MIRKISAKITFLDSVGGETYRSAMPGCTRQRSATFLSLRAAAAAAGVWAVLRIRGLIAYWLRRFLF